MCIYKQKDQNAGVPWIMKTLLLYISVQLIVSNETECQKLNIKSSEHFEKEKKKKKGHVFIYWTKPLQEASSFIRQVLARFESSFSPSHSWQMDRTQSGSRH